ncbi:hypothetical protein ACE01N_06715 [Saccharicrinis sp. FJH2]|uniref:hypothetical protein n=1 Tax=Saccharicrinis sp. FJH65 TaxID=3344659 RepID=UPI0035F3D35C
MKNIRMLKISGILMTLVLLVAACVEKEVLDLNNADFETFDVPARIAIPLAKGNVSIRDVVERLDIKDFELKTFDDGLIYFDYTTTFDISEFVKVDVPDQTHQEQLIQDGTPIPDFIPVFGGLSYPISSESKFTVQVEGAEIYEAVVNGGTFEVYADDVLGGNYPGIEQKLEVTIKELTLDGAYFNQTFTNDDFGKTHSFDMANYVLVPSVSGSDEYITIEYTYTLTNTTLSTINVAAPKSLYFEFAMRNIDPRYVRGFFGTREIYSGNSIVDIPIIDTKYVEDSTIFFKNPSVVIDLINPIAMPFDVNIKQIGLINRNKKDTTLLETDESTFSVDGGVPHFPGDYQVNITPSEFTYTFDTLNSNVEEFVGNLGRAFDKVLLNYNVVSNPAGKDPENDNVLLFDSANVMVTSTAILPLWVKAENLSYEDTVAFDFEAEVLDSADLDTTAIDNIDSVRVILGLKNSIPIDFMGQIYLADQNYNILDSVFTQPEDIVIHGAEVDGAGEVSSAVESVIELVVSPDKRNVWKPGKYILFKARAQSSSKQFVKVYDYLGLEFYVGFEASGRVNNELIDASQNQ